MKQIILNLCCSKCRNFNFNTEILKSSLYDYNDAYILVKGDITVIAAPQTQVAFKNCVPFTKWVTKVDETTIEDAENLD